MRAPRSVEARIGALAALMTMTLVSPSASADDAERSPVHLVAAGDQPPPPPTHAYLQYGVAFTVEGVAAAGPACSVPAGASATVAAKLAAAGCILGSGGGVAIRVGWRAAQDTYLGGAYEFSKQDPSNLYRLGILQQVRIEGRHYFQTGWRARPFGVLGAGMAAYGNEWGIDTWGLTGALGAGLEFEASAATALGFAIIYRPLYLRSWVDSSLIPHQAGVAHLIGLELVLEAQDRL